MNKEPEATYIKIEINVTVRSNPAAEPMRSHNLEETFKTIEELKEFLQDRYGRIPQGRNKVYRGDGANARVVGFTHTYWYRDQGDAHAYLYTDWISITDVQECVRLL